MNAGGKYAEALTIFSSALQYCSQLPDLYTHGVLECAANLQLQGRYQKSLYFLQQIMHSLSSLLGEASGDLVVVRSNIRILQRNSSLN